MELSGLSFAVATEISLSFSTQTDTGTIFLAVSGASQQDDQKVGAVISANFLHTCLTYDSINSWNIFQGEAHKFHVPAKQTTISARTKLDICEIWPNVTP